MLPRVDTETFKAECLRRAPLGAVHAAVFDVILGRVVAEVGSSKRIRNLASTTKSLCGLVIAHDVMTNGYDIHKDVSEIVNLIVPCAELESKVTLAHLMHHTGGINEIDFTDPAVILDAIFRKKNTHDILGDYLTCLKPGSPFKYSPILGYMLVGAIYELDKRKTDRSFSIKKRCVELFFTPKMVSWEWRMCDGQDVCNHTFAFSEFSASGEDMLELGRNLMRNHSKLLDFIMTPGPAYVKHARSSRASGASEEREVGLEVDVKHDYSYGWWILSNTKTLMSIGLGGQYIVLDTYQRLIGIRQQGDVFLKERNDEGVRMELFRKRRSAVVNSHETYPLLVRDIYFGIDPNLESSLMKTID